VASGAVAAIVGAIQAHVGDAGIQEQACAVIAAVVQSGDRATVVTSVSGVTVILNAIAAHSQVKGVQVAGLQALISLTNDYAAQSISYLPDLPKTQTEPHLLAAQALFPQDCRELAQVLLSRM
jgi:hypothetical protein